MSSYVSNDAFLTLCISLKVPSHYEDESSQRVDEFATNASVQTMNPFFDSPLPFVSNSPPSCSPFVFSLPFNPPLFPYGFISVFYNSQPVSSLPSFQSPYSHFLSHVISRHYSSASPSLPLLSYLILLLCPFLLRPFIIFFFILFLNIPFRTMEG